MGKVIKAADLPHHKARMEHARKTLEAGATLRNKTWNELTEDEKFSLVEKLAVMAGFIKAR